MNALFKKLNYKQGSSIVVLHAPSSFIAQLHEMAQFTEVHTGLPSAKVLGFVLVFATTQQQVDEAAVLLNPLLQADAVWWFAYPKVSSKKYTCEFNRDTGWQVLGDLGFEGVRQVAIDDDWSALPFRQAQYIKSMTRRPGMALSPDGKLRTSASEGKL
jgi:hypothetical protein